MADQLYKFITYADDPNGNPLGIPGECPCQLLPLPDGVQAADAPWQVVTLAQYNAYAASKQPLYDDWAATIEAARQAKYAVINVQHDLLVGPIDALQQSLTAAVGNAQTVDAINAINVLDGWPTVTQPPAG